MATTALFKDGGAGGADDNGGDGGAGEGGKEGEKEIPGIWPEDGMVLR